MHREHRNTVASINRIFHNESLISKNTSALNHKQLDKKQLKILKKSLPSKEQKFKRKLTIKSKKKSNSFIKWLFSNREL